MTQAPEVAKVADDDWMGHFVELCTRIREIIAGEIPEEETVDHGLRRLLDELRSLRKASEPEKPSEAVREVERELRAWADHAAPQDWPHVQTKLRALAARLASAVPEKREALPEAIREVVRLLRHGPPDENRPLDLGALAARLETAAVPAALDEGECARALRGLEAAVSAFIGWYVGEGGVDAAWIPESLLGAAVDSIRPQRSGAPLLDIARAAEAARSALRAHADSAPTPEDSLDSLTALYQEAREGETPSTTLRRLLDELRLLRGAPALAPCPVADLKEAIVGAAREAAREELATWRQKDADCSLCVEDDWRRLGVLLLMTARVLGDKFDPRRAEQAATEVDLALAALAPKPDQAPEEHPAPDTASFRRSPR